MGLFGTVVGMIEIFGSQGGTGMSSSPQQLAHGISVALYNTAAGLIVAIPSMIFYRHYRGKVDGLVVEMETQAIKLVEIVHGDRPVSQLVRWTAPRVHEDLARRAVLVAQAGLHRAGHGRGRRPDLRPQVESIHSCFVSREIAEVSARVRYGGRSRAVAARFEILGGRWQCTALEFA